MSLYHCTTEFYHYRHYHTIITNRYELTQNITYSPLPVLTGVLDYAGGNVVHICSGVSGLATVLVIGNRKGFGKERFEPHNILVTFMGMSMLWVGW